MQHCISTIGLLLLPDEFGGFMKRFVGAGRGSRVRGSGFMEWREKTQRDRERERRGEASLGCSHRSWLLSRRCCVVLALPPESCCPLLCWIYKNVPTHECKCRQNPIFFYKN